jgi:DNA-binding CsgD family transcriptional regulator
MTEPNHKRHEHPPHETGLRELLELTRDYRCLVVAQMSFDGLLLDANQGFLELELVAREAGGARDVRDAFISPQFAEFCARRPDSQRNVYQGLMTIGDRASQPVSVRGRIQVFDSHLWLVAEHDLNELQRLAQTALTLNERLASQQRELLRARRALELEQSGNGTETSLMARLAARLGFSGDGRNYHELHEVAQRRLARLTPREREVLAQLSQGRTHRRIAEALGISERTVATHRDNIMRKTEAGSVAELIQLYLVA